MYHGNAEQSISIERNYAYRGFCTRPACDFAVAEPREYDRQFRGYFRNKALTIDSCERGEASLYTARS